MTKDVLITISGLQMIEGDESSPVEIVTTGTYYRKNDRQYILYDEVMEEFGGVTKNRVQIGDGCMEIFKHGVSCVHMIFDPGRKTLTSYQTPYGSFLLGIGTRRLQIGQDENTMDIKIEYDLDVNDEHLAECTLRMNIRPREAKNFLTDD